jgi:hypothetical protein
MADIIPDLPLRENHTLISFVGKNNESESKHYHGQHLRPSHYGTGGKDPR